MRYRIANTLRLACLAVMTSLLPDVAGATAGTVHFSDHTTRVTDSLKRKGTILEIGSGLQPPEHAEIVEATGLHVYPVLIGVNTRGLVASSDTSWIDETVPAPSTAAHASTPTLLDRLTSGRGRLWFIAGGVLAVFAGLMLDGGPSVDERRRQLVPRWGRGRTTAVSQSSRSG